MDDVGANLKAFVAHVESLKSIEDGFEKEYAKLKEQSAIYKKTIPSTVGALPCNSKKNRYKDILPYDHSRVELPLQNDVEGSDYINANRLQTREGSPVQCRVIAAQGPLSSTVLDFWRALWVHRISVVVMVARVVEMGKKKCEKYWPDDGSAMRYGEVTVFNDHVDETNAPNFVVRTMRIQCGTETRDLTHYQYLAWPDHGVPDSPTSVMLMLRQIREKCDVAEAPMVIHCSAGCGRTGTVAVIDDIWTSLEDGYLTLPIDIYAVADRFRKCRQAIIQTKEQYFYAYKAVLNLMEEIRKGAIPKAFKRSSTPNVLAAENPPPTANTTSPTSPTAALPSLEPELYVNYNITKTPGKREPLYVNMDKFGVADGRARAFTQKLNLPEVNDVQLSTISSLNEDELNDGGVDTQTVTPEENDRSGVQSWETSKRDSSVTRSKIEDFEFPLDYGSRGNRIEMPIGGRLPTNFQLNLVAFPKTYVN